MKALFLVGMLTCGFWVCGADAPKPDPRLNADTVVWAGLDYSMVRMIGPGDFGNPDAIFPAMPESWNRLFVRERLGSLARELNKRVVADVGGMTNRNRLAGPKQVIPSGGPDDVVGKSHITPQDIADAVKSYELENKTGLGLVFIVDRLVKPSQTGAIYAVYFDLATREVLAAERKIGWAGGNGFRNYWFGVVKMVAADLAGGQSFKAPRQR